jgi:hypothetical protein
MVCIYCHKKCIKNLFINTERHECCNHKNNVNYYIEYTSDKSIINNNIYEIIIECNYIVSIDILDKKLRIIDKISLCIIKTFDFLPYIHPDTIEDQLKIWLPLL